MGEYEYKAKDEHDRAWLKNKNWQGYHTNAHRPDDLQEDLQEIQVERPAEANHCEFKKNEPKATGKQLTCSQFFIAHPGWWDIGAGTGQENENGCTHMCDPPGKKSWCAGMVQICWVELKVTEEKAGMIERHK